MSIAKVIPGDPVIAVGSLAFSAITQAIKSLYRIVGEINDFIDDHIDQLKASDNPLVASTGRVLEAAKTGFGIGYMSSVVIIAVGQYLLGNTLAAVVTVATAVTLTNPIAMTCAAVGAIYYGWNALTDKERAQILDSLASRLTMGIELIRSLVGFVIRKSQELMTSNQLEDVKTHVKTQAALFGKSLYDVTRRVGDAVKGSVESAGELFARAGDAVKGGVESAGELLVRAGDAVVDGAESGYDSITKAGGELRDTIKKTVQRGEPVPSHVAGSFAPLHRAAQETDASHIPLSDMDIPPKSPV